MRTKRILKVLLVAMLFVGIGLLANTKVHAYYYGSVSNLRQTGATKNSVTVNWTAAAGAARYRVEFRDWNSTNPNFRVAATVTGTSHTISELQGGGDYVVRVMPISAANEMGSTRTIYDVITLPDKISKFKQDVWYYGLKQFNVGWDRVASADGYEIEIYNGKNKRIKKATLGRSTSYYSQKKVSNTQVYRVRLRAFTNFNGRKHYSGWHTTYCFTQPQISSARITSSKLNVSWKKVPGVTGYDIYVSTKRNKGYKKVKSVGRNTTKTTVSKFNKKKFNSKKTYYVYIEAKKKVGKTTYKSGSPYTWRLR